jgi:hypothetical protein
LAGSRASIRKPERFQFELICLPTTITVIPDRECNERVRNP